MSWDDVSLLTLRRIQHLRVTCGASEAGLRLFLGLGTDLERLRTAVKQKW
jgi:hypothetical protein